MTEGIDGSRSLSQGVSTFIGQYMLAFQSGTFFQICYRSCVDEKAILRPKKEVPSKDPHDCQTIVLLLASTGYYPVFSSSCLTSVFTGILVAITFASNKNFRLVYRREGSLKRILR